VGGVKDIVCRANHQQSQRVSRHDTSTNWIRNPQHRTNMKTGFVTSVNRHTDRTKYRKDR
jgi:hypothetical protein